MGDAYSGQDERTGKDKARKAVKRKWTPEEDEVLIASLSELCNTGWKRENGSFRNGYTAALQRKLRSKIPGCTLKASPHIESRLKLLKRQYDAITEMQNAAGNGMEWDSKRKILICKDSNVWEEWVQSRPHAKGLRNKHFPYYDDLHFLFGNRGTRKGLSNNELGGDDRVFECDDNNGISITNLIVDDTFEEDDIGNNEAFQNGSFDKGGASANNNGVSVGANYNSLIGCSKERESQRDASNCNILPDHEGGSGQSEDSTGTGRSNDDEWCGDAIVRAEKRPHSPTSKKKSRDRGSGPSELGELAKIFGTFLEKYQEHFSILGEIVGREAAAERRAGEKRARLNGELSKLPNLNLQARLRAATLIVTDPAKLDLFYSLSKDERREWVSMLLSGLI